MITIAVRPLLPWRLSFAFVVSFLYFRGVFRGVRPLFPWSPSFVSMESVLCFRRVRPLFWLPAIPIPGAAVCPFRGLHLLFPVSWRGMCLWYKRITANPSELQQNNRWTSKIQQNKRWITSKNTACSGPRRDEIGIILRSRAKTFSSLNTGYRAGSTIECLSLYGWVFSTSTQPFKFLFILASSK